MDEPALQTRLDAVERRQSLTLALLVGVYLLGGLWVVVREVAVVTAWHAGVGVVALGVAALMTGIYRRRRAR